MKKLIVLILCCLMLTACAAKTPAPTEPATQPEPTQTEPAQTQPQQTLTVYRGNENADGLLSRTVTVDHVDADVVVSLLASDGVFPTDVAVLSLTQEGSRLNIDFNKAFSDYLNSFGTAGEMMLVGSVVNTFLSAYGAETVMLTAEGKTIESGHVIYDFPLEFQN